MIQKAMAWTVSALLLGAVTAYACGEDATKTSASVASNDGCASKASVAKGNGCGSKSAQANYASTAGGDQCAQHKARSAAYAGGDHCATKGAVAGGCVYGDNTVAINGDCPTANEADYALAISDAHCKDTGTAVARAIKGVPGVSAVTVDYNQHIAFVCADGKKAGAKQVMASLKKAGYKNAKVAGKGREYCRKAHSRDEV